MKTLILCPGLNITLFVISVKDGTRGWWCGGVGWGGEVGGGGGGGGLELDCGLDPDPQQKLCCWAILENFKGRQGAFWLPKFAN